MSKSDYTWFFGRLVRITPAIATLLSLDVSTFSDAEITWFQRGVPVSERLNVELDR